ncbi:RICIN domain-containing protein [Phytomonospora sp. NPDC050363]|uniref:RICIN domain-containing protein n=1 Tax=Phytomonospora sp. NPDC050363 TaxID=3155642 RepID=UPI0033CEAD25
MRTWTRQRNAVSVHVGALAFSLRVEETWAQTGGSARFPEYDVHPASPWNYGLVPGRPITTATGGDLDDPFTLAGAPLRLTAEAQRIDAWQADGQRVIAPLHDGPVAASTPVERVTLIPMGAARLRLTSFPQTGGTRPWLPPGASFRIQNRHSGKVLGVHGMSTMDSANVVQFADNATPDHDWRIA